MPYMKIEPSQQQQPHLNINDAMNFVEEVKDRFIKQPHISTEFINILHDFRSNPVDRIVISRRVNALFAGHPDLIRGFNRFMPAQLEAARQERRSSIVYQDPSIFTYQLERLFRQQPYVYHQLLDVCVEVQDKSLRHAEVAERFASFLDDNPGILESIQSLSVLQDHDDVEIKTEIKTEVASEDFTIRSMI